MRQMSAFEYYLRTGRRLMPEDPVEQKFNPWHDPEDGRFTFAGQGRHFGGGASRITEQGARRLPGAKLRASSAGARIGRNPPTSTAPGSTGHARTPSPTIQSAASRQPGPNQDSARPLWNIRDSLERMRREMIAARNTSVVASEIVQNFKRHMIPKEGNRNDVYRDSRGIPTVGIGHKVVPSDKLKLGDRISDARKEAFWRQDSAKALRAALRQMREAEIDDPKFLMSLASVNFQLGSGWYKKFDKTWALIMKGDYEAAAREAQDSDWYGQSPDRVEAFQKALRALPPKPRPKK